MGAVQTWMAGRMTQLIIDCRDVQRGTFLYDSSCFSQHDLAGVDVCAWMAFERGAVALHRL
jgi:hypothetical protein